MSLKVRKSSLIMSAIVVLLWIPALIIKYPAINNIISPLKNIMLIGFAALFFVKKKKINIYNKYLIVFIIIYIGITAVLGGDYKYAINASYKIVFSCITLQLFIDKNNDQTFSTVKNVLGLLVLGNVATLILFPNGVHVVVNVVNEWYTSESAWWLFGPKNNMIMWIIAANLLSQISIMQRKYRKISIVENPKNNVFDYIVILTTILTPVLTKSSTSLFVMLILSSVVIFRGIYENVNSKMMIWIIIGMYIILSVALYSMSSSNFLSFFAGLFGKDTTFTGRTHAWASAIAMIIKKPIWGYGYISSRDMQSLLGASAFVNTHNTLLQVLVNGGLILGVVFISYIICLVKRIAKAIQSEKHSGVLLIIAMAAIFIEMCFEAFSTSEQYWLFLLLIGMVADRITSGIPQNKMVD